MLTKEDLQLFKKVSVVMCYRPDKGIRYQHRVWIEKHFKAMLPGAEIIIAEDNGRGWDTFNKSKMLNKGVAMSKGEILFITDIDMVFVRKNLIEAFRKAGDYSIIFPMNKIYFATLAMTERIMATVTDWKYPRIATVLCKRKDRRGRQANGSYVITRENYYKAGGHDERFVGWGSEDSAFIKAASTMIPKPYLRMAGDSIHLYHPRNRNRFKERDANPVKVELNKRYRQASMKPIEMQKLIDERRASC